ncbi:MAG: glycosyltransferase family 4 protein [Asgard group archaeon]|nr:glycosyltransferase family 4 protein [Asgard group archaeon]
MTNKKKLKIAVVTLIQEGAVKIGGEHAMLFPYVEQIIKAANTVKEKVTLIPYVISPRPKSFKSLPTVQKLIKEMAATNGGKMILVSNGADMPYKEPWNWEKYGFEANKALIDLHAENKFDGIIIMAHGFASVPVILDMKASQENSSYDNIPIISYYITHSSFEEHKDNIPQRRMLEQEVQHHAKMIAISPYMADHLEELKLVEKKEKTIPLYNALPEKGWFSSKIPLDETIGLINVRNKTINKGPFFGTVLPLKDILSGNIELVLYFGRAQKYVKGTDAVIACAKNDLKRHYMLICSGSEKELDWHRKLIENTSNITLAWEHNSKLILGIVQISENSRKSRIYSVFLSRREPMGLVSREVVLMQDDGAVLPIVSNNCGFEDQWQQEFSYLVTNPSAQEDDPVTIKTQSKLTKNSEIFIHDKCIEGTLNALDSLSSLTLTELRKRVKDYRKAIEENYTQDRYWAFYMQTLTHMNKELKSFIDSKLKENNLQTVLNV